MDSLGLLLTGEVESADEELRSMCTSQSGVTERWQRIIAKGIRSYVINTGAVSSFDVSRSLSQIPEKLRDGWLQYPNITEEVSRFSRASNNPLIVGLGVEVITLGEAVSRIPEYGAVDKSSFSTGFRSTISTNTELFYKDLDQIGRYFSERFGEPEVIARFKLIQLPELR